MIFFSYLTPDELKIFEYTYRTVQINPINEQIFYKEITRFFESISLKKPYLRKIVLYMANFIKEKK